MRGVNAALLALAGGLALLAGSVEARRPEQDFDFADDLGRRPRRYIYDPHNALCAGMRCARRELCVISESRTPVCATKRDILRRGDTLVAASAMSAARADDDVFYETAAPAPARCVGCGRRRGAGGGEDEFLCGSDNRTYSSLCRLDLHNCVRRGGGAPVTLACRGFCPCRAAPPPRPAANDDADTERWDTNADTELDLDGASGAAQNEVWSEPRHAAKGGPGADAGAVCGPERARLAERLLDWFSVLMERAAARPPPPRGFPRDCKPEVRWMFAHLDADGDGRLSAHDLYALRHDEREPCLRPFLASCGAPAAGDGEGKGEGGLSRAQWCGCLRRAARPCLAMARAHPLGGAAGRRGAAGGAYVPACDARGFYRPRQCHRALGVCWCVTPHGQELPGSRTKGAPSCPPASDGATAAAAAAPADDEDADDDYEDGGSGDGAHHDLRF